MTPTRSVSEDIERHSSSLTLRVGVIGLYTT